MFFLQMTPHKSNVLEYFLRPVAPQNKLDELLGV